MLVNDLISHNCNEGVSYKINGNYYFTNENIPLPLLDSVVKVYRVLINYTGHLIISIYTR